MAILYGILIAFLMGASAFGGFVLCMKVRKQGVRYVQMPLGDDGEVQAIQESGWLRTFNIEDQPDTASGTARRFAPRSHSEELKHGTKPK